MGRGEYMMLDMAKQWTVDVEVMDKSYAFKKRKRCSNTRRIVVLWENMMLSKAYAFKTMDWYLTNRTNPTHSKSESTPAEL